MLDILPFCFKEKLRHDYEEDASQASPYMDMTPGNVTPPSATTAPAGYVDMTPGSISGKFLWTWIFKKSVWL